jgi:hypothetical protein
VPERAETAYPHAIKRTIGPPPGVSRADCGDAEVLIDDASAGDGMGLTFRAFFQPTDAEIETLRNGGYIQIHLRGNHLLPFGASIL